MVNKTEAFPEPEVRSFRVHNNIINHLITAQGATEFTALKELVQNSIDAGATRVDITAGGRTFEVSDNGGGFSSGDEIREYFETFGTPHLEAYSDKFGKFRLGRSQIMGLASTEWRSNEFVMKVDIEQNGLTYELSESAESFKGCCIKGRFYEEHAVGRWDIDRKLAKAFKYFFQVEIFLNGEKINVEMTPEIVLLETDNIYVLKNFNGSPGVYLYNMGSFVNEYDSSTFGLDAVVITKKNLVLDISRKTVYDNDYWKLIKSDLNKLKANHIRYKNKKLSDLLRKTFIADYLGGEMNGDDFIELRVFVDYAKTKSYSFLDLLNMNQPVSFIESTEGGAIADYLASSRRVIILLQDDFREFDVEIDEIPGLFQEIINSSELMLSYPDECVRLLARITPFDQVEDTYPNDFEVLKDEDLSGFELAALKSIRNVAVEMRRALKQNAKEVLLSEDRFTRKIFAGVGSAEGWTNGADLICIHKNNLALLNRGKKGADKVLAILIHEYCHDNFEREDHSGTFYKAFHDLFLSSKKRGLISEYSQRLVDLYYKFLNEGKLKVSTSVGKEVSKFFLTMDECIKRSSNTAILVNDRVESFMRVEEEKGFLNSFLKRSRYSNGRWYSFHLSDFSLPEDCLPYFKTADDAGNFLFMYDIGKRVPSRRVKDYDAWQEQVYIVFDSFCENIYFDVQLNLDIPELQGYGFDKMYSKFVIVKPTPEQVNDVLVNISKLGFTDEFVEYVLANPICYVDHTTDRYNKIQKKLNGVKSTLEEMDYLRLVQALRIREYVEKSPLPEHLLKLYHEVLRELPFPKSTW